MQNISGLTIVNSSTGQSLPSTCPGGVRFHNPSGGAHNYGVTGGPGTRCTDSSLGNFDTLAASSQGPGAIDLTVVANPIFLQDSLIFAANAALDGRQAPIGGLWQNLHRTIVENSAGTGVQTGTADISNDCQCLNLVTPPSANYSIEATLNCTDALGKSTFGIIMHATASPDQWYMFRYGKGSQKLIVARWSGVNTTLASVNFQLGTAHTPVVTIKFQYIAGTITWFINGVSQGIILDSTFPSAGLCGVISQTPPADFPDGSFITNLTATAL